MGFSVRQQLPSSNSVPPLRPTLLALLCLISCQVYADDSADALLNMDLGQLTQLPVVTASRHEQTVAQAPAVITVLDGEDMRRHGYRSVAEALAQVPGFYVIGDGVGNYVVVRGIDSGERAYGRTLKVMLDGQPLGLRSNGSQFLGPELIPMGIIDRIEVVQGPASALYGADAFLGVINIITRDDPPAARINLGVGHMQGSGGGGDVSAEALSSFNKGPWSAVATASGERDNRSGLLLPASSPDYGSFSGDQSSYDLGRPLSSYARLRYSGDNQTHTLALQASELDSSGEFLDFGTLDPSNRIAEAQQTLSWLSDWEPADSQHYQLRMAHAWGGPDNTMQHLSLGQTDVYPEEDFGYRSDELGLEAQFSQGSQHLVVGGDGCWDDESPIDIFSIGNDGAATPLSTPGAPHLFRNIGTYMQYQWLPAAGWSPSLNWRHDDSDHYGSHDSYRLGLSRALTPRLSTKLLYGTSFQAPNAYELYAQPLYPGDVLGNPDLAPETASSSDVQLLWQARDKLLLTLTAYHMTVSNLIELEPYGINQRWSNLGTEAGNGLSTELRWQAGASELRLNSSYQRATVSMQQPLTPTVQLPTASAPSLINSGEWLYRLEGSELGIESRYASARRASDSNIAIDQAYQLPGYTVWRLHAMRQWGAQRLTLTLDNALDRHYSEPGYGGVDLPGSRRTLWLSWSWEAGS